MVGGRNTQIINDLRGIQHLEFHTRGFENLGGKSARDLAMKQTLRFFAAE